MRWSPRKYSPIGIDVGTHSFKAVQMLGDEVSAAITLPRNDSAAALSVGEITRLCDVLRRRGFVGREVAVAIPGDAVMTSVLELPPRAPGMPVQQLAAAEFGRAHKVEAAGLSLSAWELPPTARASKATFMLGVGAKSEALENHVDLLEAAGLSVIAVDDPYSAAARGCQYGSVPSHDLWAAVDLGWTCWTLAIVKGDVIIYTRDLTDSGLAELFKEAVESLGAKPEDVCHALWRHGYTAAPADMEADGADPDLLPLLSATLTRSLKEIGQAIGYAGHQYPDIALQRLHLVGGGALVPGMAERFSAALELPCAVGTGHASPAADQMAALGLARMPEVAR